MLRVFLLFVVCMQLFAPDFAAAEWFKGNIHTHTLNSDGDSTPDDVVRWYRSHKYNFLVISDHNFTTDIRGLNDIFAAEGKFLLITGNEVSVNADGKPVHMLAIEPESAIHPSYNEATVRDALARNLAIIRDAGALPVVCHPNFWWALTADDLAATDGWHLLEIANKHSSVNNAGGGGHPGTEEIWDDLLTRGMRVYGVADDDAHYFQRFAPELANPGRGWIMVRSDELSPAAITAAIAAGDFYFSTGVDLADVVMDNGELRVSVTPRNDEVRYTIEFIGSGGRILKTGIDTEESYRMKDGDGYVRARVIDSNGWCAWTQPLFPDE